MLLLVVPLTFQITRVAELQNHDDLSRLIFFEFLQDAWAQHNAHTWPSLCNRLNKKKLKLDKIVWLGYSCRAWAAAARRPLLSAALRSNLRARRAAQQACQAAQGAAQATNADYHPSLPQRQVNCCPRRRSVSVALPTSLRARRAGAAGLPGG